MAANADARLSLVLLLALLVLLLSLVVEGLLLLEPLQEVLWGSATVSTLAHAEANRCGTCTEDTVCVAPKSLLWRC